MYGSGAVLIPRVTYVHANGIAEKRAINWIIIHGAINHKNNDKSDSE
jgi:hypothetical protein